MRVFITGESGFIGSHLRRELEDAGHLVAGIDIQSFCLGDHKAEVLIHLEDSDCVSESEAHVSQAVGDTAGVTAEVAKMCGELGIRLVYASTDEIYGDNGNSVSSEEEGPFGLPKTTHALGKLMGESLGLLYAPSGLTVLRIGSCYGPGQPANDSPVVDLLLRASHGLPMPINAELERSWCWIGDTVRGIRLAMEKGEGVYNVGRDDERMTLSEVAELACSIAGAAKDLITSTEVPAQVTAVRRLSTQKLQRLGWSPRVSLYEGMELTLNGWVKDLDETGSLRVPLASQ
jgi:nucleoside-diphosphate-sugar epimerase